jgi:Family of unknown function (DUF6152)
MRKLLALSTFVTCLVALPAIAHHGWSSYESDKPITLTGTVVETAYTYPHGTIKLDVAGKTWLAVLAPPSRMSARGLASADLKAGIQATVEGYPNRDDPAEMRAERITIGGKTTELR